MQVPFVMMLAVTGLGCQNKPTCRRCRSDTCYQVDSTPLASDQQRLFDRHLLELVRPDAVSRDLLDGSTTPIQSRIRPTGTLITFDPLELCAGSRPRREHRSRDRGFGLRRRPRP